MEYGKVHCGGCQKIVGYFPADNQPKDKQLELYCNICIAQLELDEEMQDMKDNDNEEKSNECEACNSEDGDSFRSTCTCPKIE